MEQQADMMISDWKAPQNTPTEVKSNSYPSVCITDNQIHFSYQMPNVTLTPTWMECKYDGFAMLINCWYHGHPEEDINQLWNSHWAEKNLYELNNFMDDL